MINIIKLAVGIEDVDHLMSVQQRRLSEGRVKHGSKARLWHQTRNAPKRSEELLRGGSIYWVIKGHISARQRLLDFEVKEDEEGRKICLIFMDPEIILTVPWRHRAFQGWRYFEGNSAPPDQSMRKGVEGFPPKLLAELKELGLL